MKHVLFLLILPVFIFSCKSENSTETKDSDDESSEEIEQNEPEIPKEEVYRFESLNQAVLEFMECTVEEDGSHSWVYSSERNQEKVKLGSREEAGFEVVYFYGKPKELYWIYGSECGFTLSDETRKTSQWYGQVAPKCADDMFE